MSFAAATEGAVSERAPRFGGVPDGGGETSLLSGGTDDGGGV